MEERIVDDEFGRGIRLKKTKDGYVDAVDALAVDEEEEGVEELTVLLPEELQGEEEEGGVYVVPTYHGGVDDEELVDLSPEEAERVRKEKAEALEKRKLAYQNACADGERFLAEGSFRAAELAYEKALRFDELATEASVGYWRAKTSNFSEPDILVEEYLEGGMDELESDLGYEATNIIKIRYKEVFEKRMAELTEQERPYAEEVEEKQTERRQTLKTRLKNTGFLLACFLVPFVALLATAIFIGLQNFSTPDDRYVIPTIGLGCAAFIAFIATLLVTNKFFNACRMYAMNENLTSTEEGKALLEIREYKEMYAAFLTPATEVVDVEDTEEELSEDDTAPLHEIDETIEENE